MKKQLDPDFQMALNQGRLLIISPFKETVTRVTEQTALIRNQLMIELADEVLIAHASPGGKLEKLIQDTGKRIIRF
ncbi:hypothetical protein [Nibrella viscosa]